MTTTNEQPMPDEYIFLHQPSPIAPLESNLQALNHNGHAQHQNPSIQSRTSRQHFNDIFNVRGNDYLEVREKGFYFDNNKEYENEDPAFRPKSYLALQDAEEHVDGNINFYDAIIYEEPSELGATSTRRGRHRHFSRHKHLITGITLGLLFLAVTAIGVLIWRLAASSQSQTADNSSNAKSEEDIPPPLPALALCGNVTTNELDECRQSFIRQMTVEAFSAYQQYSWGAPELSPLTLEPYNDRLSPYPGLTIVDAMVTLSLMNLTEQWQAGRNWIETILLFENLDYDISLREAVTDYLGGLLSAYTISGDQLFLNKSIAVASAFSPAFHPLTGMLPFQYNVKQRKTVESRNYIASIGFQQPELIYLANLTRNENRSSELADHLVRIRSTIQSVERPYGGLYLNQVDSATGAPSNIYSSMLVWATDFYYNMLRSYIQLGRRDRSLLEMYSTAVDTVQRMGLFLLNSDSNSNSSSPGQQSQHLYHLTYNSKTLQHYFGMDESGCALGALFALGARELLRVNSSKHSQHRELAVNITETCYFTANATRAKMLPNEFMLGKVTDPRSVLTNSLPETYFTLWRTTHDVKYRERAWELALSLYRYSRTSSGGYVDLKNVNSAKLSAVEQRDYQRAILFSGTFRYLYLIFGSDSVFSLDDWIFNSAGHPLPICGHHERYPKEFCEPPTGLPTTTGNASTSSSSPTNDLPDQERVPKNETTTTETVLMMENNSTALMMTNNSNTTSLNQTTSVDV